MAKFPTYEEMSKKVAEKALDEFLHDGKSIREWMQIIASEDAISRQAVLDATVKKNSIWNSITNSKGENLEEIISQLPPINSQKPKTGHCKDCKYFEYNSVAKVDGIPLIVAHEICSRWGDGCKTSENGYCFLFKSKAESEEKE